MTIAHVRDVGLTTATDAEIFSYSADHGLLVLTADTDFSFLLVAREALSPSVILLRHVAKLRPRALSALLIDNLPAVVEELARGAVVSLSPNRLSVRRLPIGGDVKDQQNR